MANPLTEVEDFLKSAFGRAKKAVEESEKIIAGDVRGTLAAAKQAVDDNEPAVKAALIKGFEAAEAAVETYLKARGL